MYPNKNGTYVAGVSQVCRRCVVDVSQVCRRCVVGVSE